MSESDYIQCIERVQKNASEGSGYKFFGRDHKNVQHPLTQDWIDINFKLQYPEFYHNIHDPQVNKNSFEVPESASTSCGM